MKKLDGLSFEKFKELTEFLKFGIDEKEAFNVTVRLERFISNIDALKQIELFNIVSLIFSDSLESAENLFLEFTKKHPECEFDESGKLDLSPKRYFEIELQSCELLYENAEKALENSNFLDKSFGKVNTQIYNAKTLNNLIALNDKKCQYATKRTLYFKTKKDPAISLEQFKGAEKNLESIFHEKHNIVLAKFLECIYNQPFENVHFFVEHFLTRLRVAAEDKSLEYSVNYEFVENLKKIV